MGTVLRLDRGERCPHGERGALRVRLTDDEVWIVWARESLVRDN